MSISQVTSEALQLKLRELLPSQQGFSTDISASDTIIPIVDLTRAAEGSDVGQNLQTAWDFNTGFDTVRATTTTIASTAGFWQCGLTCAYDNGGTSGSFVFLDDGATTKNIWYGATTGAGSGRTTIPYEFVVFLRAGDELKATGASGDEIAIWYRQIADVNGTLVNPSGFSPQ